MSEWSYARIWRAVAAEVPEREAVVCGERRVTFGELDERSDRLARLLAAEGVGPGSSVALMLVNSPEYLEGFAAALKLGSPPVNVNYRYREAELAYLLDNADAGALLYQDDFADVVEAAVGQLTRPPVLLRAPYDLTGAPDTPLTHEPSGDDLVLLYTGGTTGMPKGVMWRNEDLYLALWAAGRPGTPPRDPVATVRAGKRAVTTLPASPLMHGTGLFFALSTLSGGGTVVLLDRPRLDAEAVWDAVAAEAVGNLVIVGDAFARPLLAALDAHPGRWDLSPLKAITSSGVMWSPETKRALLDHLPHVLLIDSMGASEGIMTRSTARAADDHIPSARFERNERITVLTENGQEVTPGSGEVGLLAVGGHLPLGYYKDPDKTAATFRELDGRRWSVPGDYATVEADGTIRLLGRGSQCINTGGEKVYAEEVDEVVKAHPSVLDCVVVGVPDERWGERVVALVRPRDRQTVDPAQLDRHCHERLAGYKCPKAWVVLDDLHRSPSGKADYALLRSLAREHA